MKALLFIISLLALLFFTTCRTGKKLVLDIEKISTSDYYSGYINKTEKLFVHFNSVTDDINGNYFIAGKSAIVSPQPFVIKTKGNTFGTTVDYEGQNIKIFGVAEIKNDSLLIAFSTNNKNKELKKIVLVKETTDTSPVLPQRYYKEVFRKSKVTAKTYGKAEGYYCSKLFQNVSEDNYAKIIVNVGSNIVQNILMTDLNLDMDIYEPQGDTLKNRPLIVILHGGSFLIGDKKVETMVDLGEYYASLGYVVASINYRLGYIIMPGHYDYMERSIYRAVQDARAAIRYLIANATNYKIDPENIFIAGTSAGGFTALNAGFMSENERYESTTGNVFKLQKDLGCIDCSGNNLKNKFSLKGIVNMWGGLTDLKFMDKDEITPLLLIHGNADDIVPIDYDFPFKSMNAELSSYFTKKIFGSRAIYDKAKEFGFPCRLIVLENAGHEPQVDSKNQFTSYYNTIKEETRTFFAGLVNNITDSISGNFKIKKSDLKSDFKVNHESGNKYFWLITGGKETSRNKDGNQISVAWFNGNKHTFIKLIVLNKSGGYSEQTANVSIEQ